MTYKEEKPPGYNLGVLMGRAVELTRIVELLEDFDDSNLWRQTGPDTLEGFDIAEIIELINGESNAR
jgi:hypothetical protein